MKTNTIIRAVKVTIDNATLLNLFVQAVTGNLMRSSGREITFYKALGHLVGISDIDAVKKANSGMEKENRITTKEFRRWLPTVFAEFARVMLEADE